VNIPAPRPVTFVSSLRLAEYIGIDLTLASETFQYTGSFKFRAAFNHASQSPATHLVAVSSGNFGQAMAYACRLHGKRCTVVMPHDSATIKVDAVRGHGADVDLVDTRTTPRLVRLAEVLAEHPGAEVAYPSDGERTLAAYESLGLEIMKHRPAFDAVIAPIGGGGVIVGLIRAARQTGSRTTIWAAEPRAANDVAQSFRTGQLVRLPNEPVTLADGVRALGLSEANWNVVRDGCHGVIEVDEARIVEAMRLLFTHANLKAEPTASLALAALLTRSEALRGLRVCCVVTGANVDPAVYARALLAM
jgi:threonine dehydratase